MPRSVDFSVESPASVEQVLSAFADEHYWQARLAAFAATVRTTKASEIWCVFDNTARHAAWDDALKFVAALRSHPHRSK